MNNLIQQIHLDKIKSISYNAAGASFKINVGIKIAHFTVSRIVEDEANKALIGTNRYLIYAVDGDGQEHIWKSVSESMGVVIEQYI
jgi:hypothetical protein